MREEDIVEHLRAGNTADALGKGFWADPALVVGRHQNSCSPTEIAQGYIHGGMTIGSCQHGDVQCSRETVIVKIPADID